MEPLLNIAGTLIQNPGIGIGVLDHGFEPVGGVFEMEKAGGVKSKAVAPLVEKLAEVVEFDKHPWREFRKAFGREKGNVLGCGGGFGRSGENAPSFSVFIWGDDPIGFQNDESGAEGVAPDLELGSEIAFAWQKGMKFTV